MGHFVHFMQFPQVSGECIPLGRREHVANVAEELHDAFGCLIGQLKMSLACGLESSAIYGRLRQALDGLSVCSLKLRVQGDQIGGRLMHEGPDFCLLRIGSIDLHVQMLEHVVDVSGHVRRTLRAVHHHAVRAHGSGHGPNATDKGSTGKECEDRLPVEKGAQDRAR
jgi:hypothetical protein